MIKQLITTKELAKVLMVSPKTIYNWRKLGMPFKSIGRGIRFDQDEVMEWIEKQDMKV